MIKNLETEDLESINGGLGHHRRCHHNRLTGERFKKKSTFGWNWYRKCANCNDDVLVEYGPWSGDPD